MLGGQINDRFVARSEIVAKPAWQALKLGIQLGQGFYGHIPCSYGLSKNTVDGIIKRNRTASATN
jgi:hypothetical protein